MITKPTKESHAEEAAEVKRKLLGQAVCSKCKKDVPEKELAVIVLCDKCWEGLDAIEQVDAANPVKRILNHD